MYIIEYAVKSMAATAIRVAAARTGSERTVDMASSLLDRSGTGPEPLAEHTRFASANQPFGSSPSFARTVITVIPAKAGIQS